MRLAAAIIFPESCCKRWCSPALEQTSSYGNWKSSSLPISGARLHTVCFRGETPSVYGPYLTFPTNSCDCKWNVRASSWAVDISAIALMCCTVSSRAPGASETLLYKSTELWFLLFWPGTSILRNCLQNSHINTTSLSFCFNPLTPEASPVTLAQHFWRTVTYQHHQF